MSKWVFLLFQGDLESNHDTPETADFFPLSATTCGSKYPRQEYTVCRVFVFVFKQGLIKLHGIQKKEMYQRIQPETRLHIWGGSGINAKLGREYCNQKRQNKSYNKLFFKKRETDQHAKMDTHIHTHTLHTRCSSLVFSVDEGSRAGCHGKRQRLDMRREGSAPLPPVEWGSRQLREGTHSLVRNKSRKKETAVYQGRFNCFKEGQRKKAQKSNTSKGTMNVELNGTKPFLRLVILYFVFVSVLKVVVVLLYSAFKRWVLKAEL